MSCCTMNSIKKGNTITDKLLFLFLPLATAWIALGIGRYTITPAQVLDAVVGRFSGNFQVTEMVYRTIWNLRVPRILLALLVGAGLSAAGCAFQSLFANPLATPDTLGVASGASFGAALGILCGFGLIGIQLISFLMGSLAVLLTCLGGLGRGRGLSSVVLSGIMMGSLFNALVSLVKYLADAETQLPAITYWLMGSLGSAGYSTLQLGALPILLGIWILYKIRWRMNLLSLTEDEARASGVHLPLLRAVTVICATMITASCVSMCGQVGWVGLLIPHMCRMRYGSDQLVLLPASISFGAVFMVVADTAARSLTASEIPVSILTAVVGAPFFIILMRKSEGWQG